MTNIVEVDGNYGRFRVGDQYFAIPADRLGEVVPVKGLQPFPEGAPYLLGATTIRGTLVPLFDPLSFAGFGSMQEAPVVALTICRGDHILALGVDQVIGLTKVASSDLQGIASGNSDECTYRYFDSDGKHSVVLDIEELFSQPGTHRAINPRIRQDHHVGQRSAEPYLTFRCGGVCHAIAVNKLFNTVPRRALDAEELADELFLGVLKYFDRSIPVVNANAVLGMSNTAASQLREVVIVHVDENRLLGFAVDQILHINYFNCESISQLPEHLRQAAPLIKATLSMEGALDEKADERVLIIDIDAVRSLERLDRLADMSVEQTGEETETSLNDGNVIKARERNLLFVAGDRFGTPICDVIRIERPPSELVPIKSTIPGLQGYFFFDDKLTPLVRLSEYLGLQEEKSSSEAQVVVSGATDRTCGFLVDRVLAVAMSDWRTVKSEDQLEEYEMIHVPKTSDQGVLWQLNLADLAKDIIHKLQA